MDGFAVRSAEMVSGKTFNITGSVAAGAAPQVDDSSGVIHIATGAAVPDQYDAVIPIEKATVQVEQVTFSDDAVKSSQHIHRQGSDATAGDIIIQAGTRLGAQHVGIAAAAGAAKLRVAAKPRITLLTSGDEIRPAQMPASDLKPQQIRNSNGPMLSALFTAMGTPVLEHVHIADDLEQTLCAAREALSQSHLVVTVGGVSVGRRDFLPMSWQQLGLDTVLHGTAIQPGKPLFVARSDCKLVIGLPGNPVSVWTTAHLFAVPVIQKMLSSKAVDAWREVELAEPVKSKSARQVFRTAAIGSDGRATVIGWHGSGDLMHTAAGGGFLRLPLIDGEVSAGTRAPYLPWVGAADG